MVISFFNCNIPYFATTKVPKISLQFLQLLVRLSAGESREDACGRDAPEGLEIYSSPGLEAYRHVITRICVAIPSLSRYFIYCG